MSPRNADQDRWLAQAASALAEAERLTGLLAILEPRKDVEIATLQSEIMGVRREIERLRRHRSAGRRRDYHADWLKSAWTTVV